METRRGADAAPGAPWTRRLAAVFEVAGVFVAGTILARLAGRWLDLGPSSLRGLPAGEQPDFVALSGSAAAQLLLRYGIVLGLALAVGWWHRRRRLAAYGVTAAGRSAGMHVTTGVLLFAAASLPALGWKFLGGVLPLGAGPAHWDLLRSLDNPGIWLYLFVGSFGLVPIVEELWARGYMQSRLAEDLGAPAAILVTAFFFTFAHTQYFIASALGIGMIASLLIGSLAAGYVRYQTGSVLPVIVAHALGNLPYRGWVEPAVLALMALTTTIWWRPVAGHASRLWRDVATGAAARRAAPAVLVLAALLGLAMKAPGLLPWYAAATLGLALWLEQREKRFAQRGT